MTNESHRGRTAALRVLLCIDSLGVGGKERQSVALVKGLAGRPDIDCRVVCFDADEFYLEDLKAGGIPVEFLVRRFRWDPLPGWRLYRLIETYQPHVIHTNGLVSSLYSLAAAKRRGIPLVNGSIRNAFSDGDFRWTVERLVLKVSEYRVANSAAGLRSRQLSEQDERNAVVYNGFDFSRVERHDGGRGPVAAAAGSGQWTVGMVAEFSAYKDYLTFIEAARMVSRRRQNVRFVAVGDGKTLAACRAAAGDLTNFSFLGARKDVEHVVSGFDIGVLCTFVEGLSNSVMEYMALAKPVIATDSGGTRELVVDGTTGILVRASDAAAVAAAVEELMDRPETAARMGQAGYERLRREFTLDRMVDDTIAVYHRASFPASGSLSTFTDHATSSGARLSRSATHSDQ